MFRIYYDVKVKNIYRELYFPQKLYKVYNYIKCSSIDLNSVEIDSVCFINGFEQKIVKKDSFGFYIAPGISIENPLSKTNYSINVNDVNYPLTFNPYLESDAIVVGSLVLENYTYFIKNLDKIRIVSQKENLVDMKYTSVTDIENLNGIYIHETNTTVLYFEHSVDTFDWLNKSENLYVHSLDYPKKDIDITLYFRCYGGNPEIAPKIPILLYDMSLKNLTNGTSIDKKIKQFGYEKINLKNVYEFTIVDSARQLPLLVNDVAYDQKPIVLDLTDPLIFLPTEIQSSNKTILPPLPTLW